MSFKVEIKNFGKLTDAEIRIGKFTVFAGPNNTGKSFVSKLLYSLFDATNTNPAETYIDHLVSSVRDAFWMMNRWANRGRLGKAETAFSLDSIEEEVDRLEALVKEASIDDLDDIIPSLISQTNKMQGMAAAILQAFLETETEEERKQLDFDLSDEPPLSRERVLLIRERRRKQQQRNLENVITSLAELKETLSQANESNFVIAGIQYKIQENLIQNFQVPRPSDLRGKKNAPSAVTIEGFGAFELLDGEMGSEIDHAWLQQLKLYSNVIYLESPVYWKLKNALDDAQDYPRRFSQDRRKRLSGVPGYFYDLVRALKFEYTGDMAFPDVYERVTGGEVIGGKIAISETGDLSFQENGRSFSLPVTATGIANLGILALLIERKVLDEGSFLFIDEPEAHLHPAWQVFMAEALFELSRQGVNVVIATHSADILKWLEVHIKKHPDDEQLVALNQFSVDGRVNDRAVDDAFETRIAEIKQELTKPFSDLYLQGL